jgi:phage-related protein (TIGR01555 family)
MTTAPSSMWSSIRSWLAPPEPSLTKPEIPSRIPRPEMELDHAGINFLLTSLGRQVRGDEDDKNPFDPSGLRPPPGVGHNGGPALAMDEAVGVSQWAVESVNGFLGPQEGFIGYPELALLAQRPEYPSPVEIIATESTRKWIKFTTAGDDKADKIKKIEAEFKRLEVQARFRQVSEYDGFFGRGHIYPEIGTDLKNQEELLKPIGDGNEMSKPKIGRGALKELRVIEPIWCWPGQYNSTNPLDPTWYRPDRWNVMSTPVHKTRLLTFVSREVGDLLKPAYQFGGQSLTQQIRPVVENWLSTRAGVGEIVKRFSHNIIKINLTEAINSGNPAKMFLRAKLFNETKGNFGTMLLDKEEDFVNVSMPLSGLDLLQAQAQEHMASLSRIPIVKLLGIQPAGLNASSAGELRAFEDMIHSYQESFFRPNLETVLRLVQVSLFGEVDPDISFEFEPLAEELPPEQAAAAAQQAIGGVVSAYEAGIIDRATALKELRSFAEAMGTVSTISSAMIEEAEESPPTPSPEELKAQALMIRAENGGGSFQ